MTATAVRQNTTTLSGQVIEEIIYTDESGQGWVVPLDPANRHYAEILRQVEAGTLTIEEADNGSE